MLQFKRIKNIAYTGGPLFVAKAGTGKLVLTRLSVTVPNAQTLYLHLYDVAEIPESGVLTVDGSAETIPLAQSSVNVQVVNGIDCEFENGLAILITTTKDGDRDGGTANDPSAEIVLNGRYM